MEKTFKELLEAGLTRLGYEQVPSRTSKYTVWKHPKMPQCTPVYVGKNGALRQGHTVGGSYSLCDAPTYKWKKEKGTTPVGATGYAFYSKLLELGSGQLTVPL